MISNLYENSITAINALSVKAVDGLESITAFPDGISGFGNPGRQKKPLAAPPKWTHASGGRKDYCWGYCQRQAPDPGAGSIGPTASAAGSARFFGHGWNR